MFKIKKIIIILIILFTSLFFTSCKDNRTDYQKGNDFLEKGEYDKAILYFKNSLKDGVKTSIFYKKLANAYIKVKHYEEASLYLTKALEMTPDDEDLIYFYVEILIKKKQYHNVVSMLKRVADSQKKFLILSDTYLQSGNTKFSYDYLNRANKYNETKEDKVKMLYAFAKKILNYHERCIEKNKLFLDLYKDLKNNVDFLKDYYKALKCDYDNLIQDRVAIRFYKIQKKFRYNTRFNILNEIIKKDKDKYYYNELAQIYIDKREFFKAREFINESKVIDSKQRILLYLDAQIDVKKRRFSTAVVKLTKYINDGAKELEALRLLAYTEYSLKNNFSSIKHYKEVVELDKYNINPLYRLKELYKRVGDKDSKIDIEYKIKFFNRKFYR